LAWRGLHITEPSKLSLSQGQLAIQQADDTVTLPIEDLAWIILDTPKATVTSACLSVCFEHGISFLFSDSRHLPAGIALPFHQHHLQAGLARDQAAISAPLKKQLWAHIVRRKILNQASALEQAGVDARSLRAMAMRVRSGDAGNLEAQAAREYWSLFFRDFRRSDSGDGRNGYLNYAYAVARAVVARAITAHGLVPALGVHHDSLANPFNLADDLLEPFRPYADLKVRETLNGRGRNAEPDVSDRRALAALPQANVRVGSEAMSFLAATELCAASLVSAIRGRKSELLALPEMA
jgi:CRISPR-associated protein Cas1